MVENSDTYNFLLASHEINLLGIPKIEKKCLLHFLAITCIGGNVIHRVNNLTNDTNK